MRTTGLHPCPVDARLRGVAVAFAAAVAATVAPAPAAAVAVTTASISRAAAAAVAACGVTSAPPARAARGASADPAAPPPGHMRFGLTDPIEADQLWRTLKSRGLAEAMEALAAPGDLDRRETLAAAYALEAAGAADESERQRLVDAALREYARLVERRASAENDPAAALAVARCRMAAGSVILRCGLAPGLNRFEMTSGLEPERSGLAARLDDAIRLLARARADLAALAKLLEADEDAFLLLGIADEIPRLTEETGLHLAWARVWQAQLAAPTAAAVEPAALALDAFVQVRDLSPSAAARHSAAIGAAVALRVLERYDESLDALARVEESKPPYDVAVRAAYERARTLAAAQRFAEARSALARLTAVDPERVPDDVAAARYYLQVAPFLAGDSYLLQAAVERDAAAAEALRKQGVEALVALAARGAAWSQLVDLYLNARGCPRDASQRSAVELAAAAQSEMQAERFAEAAALWSQAAARAPDAAAAAEANYNQAVCLLRSDRIAQAADLFLEVARSDGNAQLARLAAGQACRYRAQLAERERQPARFVELAQACDTLLQRFPDHADAPAVLWLHAAALQEAGRFASARAAYLRIASDSPNYWNARRNAVFCRLAELELDRPEASQPSADSSAAAGAGDDPAAVADDWLRLAADMRDALSAGDTRLRAEMVFEVQLLAVELLASDAARQYRQALGVLSEIDASGQPLPALRGRMLSLRIRCYRGLGDLATAAAVLDQHLKTAPSEQVGEVLIGLAAGMEAEIQRLTRLHRQAEARRVAVAAAPTLRELLAWTERQPERKESLPAVRLCLASVLEHAGETREALDQLEQLIAADPQNGTYLLRAARLHEQLGRRADGDARAAHLQAAEKSWATLLANPDLRSKAPAVYWEARHAWLRMRLEAGEAEEVLRGIEAERAWFPSLGGPPWQARLLDLADQARRAAERKQAR